MDGDRHRIVHRKVHGRLRGLRRKFARSLRVSVRVKGRRVRTRRLTRTAGRLGRDDIVPERERVRTRKRTCVRTCVRACERTCVRARVRARVRTRKRAVERSADDDSGVRNFDDDGRDGQRPRGRNAVRLVVQVRNDADEPDAENDVQGRGRTVLEKRLGEDTGREDVQGSDARLVVDGIFGGIHRRLRKLRGNRRRGVRETVRKERRNVRRSRRSRRPERRRPHRDVRRRGT